MKITIVTVRSGYTYPHPGGAFANLQGSIELTANIEPGDDVDTVITQLQIAADAAASQHKQRQLDVIEASIRIQEAPQREIDVPF